MPQENGLKHRRPIMSGACPTCVWGPLAVLAKGALAPYGYDIQVCFNCNRSLSVPVVAEKLHTPPLSEWDRKLGDPEPPIGTVDIGVTNSHSLWQAYIGGGSFAKKGAQKQLRLIAYIEDPHPFQIAAKRSLGLKDLKEVAAKKMKITVLADRSPMMPPMLAYYGLTREQIESWGGKLLDGSYEEDEVNRDKFDVIITAHGGLANNIENDLLYEASQKHDLDFLDLAPDLMKDLAQRFLLDTVTLPLGLLKGMNRPMTTVARNGQSVFARDDLDVEFAYTVAKALDESRAQFKYLNRPYFYEPRTVWKGIGGVPLHQGAERYYREAGYLR